MNRHRAQQVGKTSLGGEGPHAGFGRSARAFIADVRLLYFIQSDRQR
jgi:hypothetical protein